MRKYLKALRFIWWNKGTDDLLSFFFLWFITAPVLILWKLGATLYFTYLWIRKADVHSWYYEMIDRSGLYRCHLHDRVFRGGCH